MQVISRKQDDVRLFKKLANNDVLNIWRRSFRSIDGFGFLRSVDSISCRTRRYIRFAKSNKKIWLRTGDTVEGEIRSPKDGERYLLLKIESINFENQTI